MARAWLITLIGIAAGASPASAQIALPELPLPRPVQRTLDTVTPKLDTETLSELRALRIRTLLREHREVVDSDARGAPIVRNEIVAISPTPEGLARVRNAGFSELRTIDLPELLLRVTVLAAPENMSTRRALSRARKADPEGRYDFNHLYTDSGTVGRATRSAQPGSHAERAGDEAPAIRVGLIDGGVDVAHPALRSTRIESRGCEAGSPPSAHGTAVASLLAARGPPLLHLYAADVYCGLPTGGSAEMIARSFAWLARNRVPVINVSLVGPPNALLAAVIENVTARGALVVAAVGNDGPSSPPLYPAAYEGVVGVTAVDGARRVLLEACRGPHVDFAAQGAGLQAATPGSAAYAEVRGTSFAAPIVAAALALRVTADGSPGDRSAATAHTAALARDAVDLGRRGRDAIYGAGLVGEIKSKTK